MKRDEEPMKDELRPEYDLGSLRVRKMGSKRKSFGGKTIQLDPDVAEVFPDAEAVNEALRFLIRVTQENHPPYSYETRGWVGVDLSLLRDGKIGCVLDF